MVIMEHCSSREAQLKTPPADVPIEAAKAQPHQKLPQEGSRIFSLPKNCLAD